MLIDYSKLTKEIELQKAAKHDVKCLRFINEVKDQELGFQLGALTMGDVLHIANNSRWSLHELIVHCLKYTGPAKLYFCTFAIKETQVRLLANLLKEGILTELNALVDYRFNTRDAQAEQLLKTVCTSHRWTKRLHGKVTVIKNDTWSIVVLGSGNWTSNTSRDTFVITCMADACDYWINWINKQINDEQP